MRKIDGISGPLLLKAFIGGVGGGFFLSGLSIFYLSKEAVIKALGLFFPVVFFILLVRWQVIKNKKNHSLKKKESFRSVMLGLILGLFIAHAVISFNLSVFFFVASLLFLFGELFIEKEKKEVS